MFYCTFGTMAWAECSGSLSTVIKDTLHRNRLKVCTIFYARKYRMSAQNLICRGPGCSPSRAHLANHVYQDNLSNEVTNNVTM